MDKNNKNNKISLNSFSEHEQISTNNMTAKPKRVAWNKGLTKETDDRVAKGELTKQRNNMIKYGVANVFQTEAVKAKVDPLRHSGELAKRAKETKANRYGDPNYNNMVQMEETKTSRYGSPNYNNRDSAKKTCLAKYGVTHHNQTAEAKNKISVSRLNNHSHEKAVQTIISNYGSLDNYWEKMYEKKRLNGTLGNYESYLEKDLYAKLVAQYGEDDVEKQYFDKNRYPFKCDFYIKSEDKFIELHGTYLHGPHPFDNTNPEDLAQLEILKEKAKTSSQAQSYIYTQTDLDVRKLNTAIKNNLNFEAIYYKNHY